jgi:hypothetical protein
MQKYHAIMRLNPSAKPEISVARPNAPNPLSCREKKISKKILRLNRKIPVARFSRKTSTKQRKWLPIIGNYSVGTECY